MQRANEPQKSPGLVEIEYKPIKKIVIHEAIRYSHDEFLKRHGGSTQNLRWIDGIVFTFFSYAATPEIISDSLKGTIHWSLVEFTEMPKGEATQKGIMDNSNNSATSAAIKWLKTNIKSLEK